MTKLKNIVQSPVFAKQKKKLHKQQINDLDIAVKALFHNPALGELKRGDLQTILIYKFKMKNQHLLLAYEVVGSSLFLYTFGSHENFYRDLKNYLHH
ncbi:MAG: type II toxin-antitoxin system RelE/ParE family toxin [Nitrospinae bacterium]|nr:type II toxin-antitoxin system RelE/ParE family toxin [Nitrospinota bacterium]